MRTTKTKIVAEELLTLMCYGLDLLMMPTFRNWDQSYEGWLYKNGLLRRMQWLEAQKFLLREGKHKEWVYRLTDSGHSRVWGGRDALASWNRRWDGRWRQVMFDLPVHQKSERAKLIRWLKRNGFGYLQDSVWIRPDPVTELAEEMKSFRDDAASFTLLESRCAPGFSNQALVTGAWKFDEIQEQYRHYLQFASQSGERLRRERLHPRDLFAMLREERTRWFAAFEPDPLLPSSLLPKDYLGQKAWRTRQDLLRSFAAQSKQ